MIIYVGACVGLLYFYGIVQAVLKRMAWLMQITMGTTATESLNACACVLLGNVFKILFCHDCNLKLQIIYQFRLNHLF